MMNLGGFSFNTSMISLIKGLYKSLVVNFEHLQVLRQTLSHLASPSPPTSALQENLSSDSVLWWGLIVEAYMIFHPHFCSCEKKKELWNVQPRS